MTRMNKVVFGLLCILLLTGCNATFTKANQDFANTIGDEWATYEGTPEARTLVSDFAADEDIRWNEADAFYQAVVPSYTEHIGQDEELSEFDLRIRNRYLTDYTDLLYGE